MRKDGSASVNRVIRAERVAAGRTEQRALRQAAIGAGVGALQASTKRSLVTAELDRLARNVPFLSGLMESGVDFVACGMPSANRLTVHVLAAVAEAEAGSHQRTHKGRSSRRKETSVSRSRREAGPPKPRRTFHLGPYVSQSTVPSRGAGPRR